MLSRMLRRSWVWPAALVLLLAAPAAGQQAAAPPAEREQRVEGEPPVERWTTGDPLAEVAERIRQRLSALDLTSRTPRRSEPSRGARAARPASTRVSLAWRTTLEWADTAGSTTPPAEAQPTPAAPRVQLIWPEAVD